MPAPKHPNTTRATEAAAAVARRRGDESAAQRLREHGWLVVPPEAIAALPEDLVARTRAAGFLPPASPGVPTA